MTFGKRSLSEPPGSFGKGDSFTGTRMGSSGFSYFVPVESMMGGDTMGPAASALSGLISTTSQNMSMGKSYNSRVSQPVPRVPSPSVVGMGGDVGGMTTTLPPSTHPKDTGKWAVKVNHPSRSVNRQQPQPGAGGSYSQQQMSGAQSNNNHMMQQQQQQRPVMPLPRSASMNNNTNNSQGGGNSSQMQMQMYRNNNPNSQQQTHLIPTPSHTQTYPSAPSPFPQQHHSLPQQLQQQQQSSLKQQGGGGTANGDAAPSSSGKQAQFVEPTFYNGYTKANSNGTTSFVASEPRYGSAGGGGGANNRSQSNPSGIKMKRTPSILTQTAKAVPGGFRGCDPNNEDGEDKKGKKKEEFLTFTPRIEDQYADKLSANFLPRASGDGPTFEQYQSDKKRKVESRKSDIDKKPFNLEDLQPNSLPCLVVLSVTIETMNRLLGRTPKTDVLFEFYGILDSPVNYVAPLQAKKFTLRQNRAYINCIYFETDKPLAKVVRNHYMRCVGKWNMKLRAVVAYSARHAKQEEAKRSSVRIEQHETEVEKYFS